MSNDDPFTKLIYFIVFVCVAQFIDGYFIDPHIVGGNIKMSPFAVIFAVLVFGGLWGFWGLLIGVPTFAVIYDIVKKLVYARLIKTGKKEILREHLKEFGRRPRKKAVEANGATIDIGADVDSQTDQNETAKSQAASTDTEKAENTDEKTEQ